ncbi:Hypothetical_protein [Hexamita inflata]|uniref:Hypothetical_protein n=1 Tax=Hexamita inflata TaxID=28002 RepID=A0ABP1KJ73_9EUKA
MKLTNPNSRAEQPQTLIIVCLMKEIISCRLNHNFTHAIPGMSRFQLKQSQNQFKVNIERKLHSQRPSTCVICAFSCILISKINSKTLKYTYSTQVVNQVQILLQLQLLEQGAPDSKFSKNTYRFHIKLYFKLRSTQILIILNAVQNQDFELIVPNLKAFTRLLHCTTIIRKQQTGETSYYFAQ